MRDFFKLKMWVLTFGMMFLAISFSVVLVYNDYIVEEFSIITEENISDNIEYAMAATTDNVSGWAWSENIGWISFNCANYDTCQGGADDGLACTGSNCGDGVCINTCVNFSDYGVNVDSEDRFVLGYAWSDNVGWISFNRMTCGNGTNNGSPCEDAFECTGGGDCGISNPGAVGTPPEGPFNGASGGIAQYNNGSTLVTGWAKILSLGDDGWIKFTDVSINPISGDFSGWAYNEGSAGIGIGWISFNCADYDVCEPGSPNEFEIQGAHDECGDDGTDGFDFSCTGGVCEVGSPNDGESCVNDDECGDGGAPWDYLLKSACDYSPYVVTLDVSTLNQPPTADNLSAPNWGGVQPCGSTALKARLQWEFNDSAGATITANIITVIRDSDGTVVFNTGKCDGVGSCAQDCLEPGGGDCVANCFSYTSGDICTYEVNNSTGSGIAWNESYRWEVAVWDDSDTSFGLTPYATEPDTDNNDSVASTFTTYLHEYPSVNFTWFPDKPSQDEEIRFTDVSTADGGASIAGWSWAFENGNPAIDNIQNPVSAFTGSGSWSATLTATDSDGYSCSNSHSIDVTANLPSWTEF